jgi:hypothetical protein
VIAMTDARLDELTTELHRRGLHASLRGQGPAAFLFVEHDGKAVEISLHEGRWWVEFWEVSDDEDAAPVKDEFFTTPDQVVAAVSSWVLRTERARAV